MPDPVAWKGVGRRQTGVGETFVMDKQTDRIAVITGASSGIGRAIALSLAAQGTTPCLIGRDREALCSLADCVREKAPETRFYQADLAIGEQVEQLAERIKSDWDRLDVLVHSAGAISLGPLECAALEDFDRQFQVNVRAPFALTRALLPLLRSSRGQIVFINSTVGLAARAQVGPYAATKHALRALADSLRDEVNADGIRVLSVFLGRTASPLQEAVHRFEGRDYRPEVLLQPEDVAATVTSVLALPRTAEVTDIRMRPLAKSY
jgi:NAD(P)-dependent dehydrogenase (short-subunit alcohol dehydrogenase family)